MSESDLRELIEAASDENLEDLLIIALEDAEDSRKRAEKAHEKIEALMDRFEELETEMTPALRLMAKVDDYWSIVKWGGGLVGGAFAFVGVEQAIMALRNLFVWLSGVV